MSSRPPVPPVVPKLTCRDEVAAALGVEVVAADSIPGGDVNEAFCVRLADQRKVFVKTHAEPPPGVFALEARGLAWLDGGALLVPKVLAVSEAFLALEWLELDERPPGFEAQLGRELAALHRRGAPSFGLDHDNYLATLLQPNRAEGSAAASWPEFFVEHRLRPFATLAHQQGRMPAVDQQLDALRLREELWGPAEPPARLHGDLWSGNVAAAGGRPVVFDPAVYGGHREIDLAMLAWAGGLPDELTDAYHEVFPLADGWRQRLPLWQLLPLFSHAALFGGGYGGQAMRRLASLAGT